MAETSRAEAILAVRRFGSPLYLYDLGAIEARLALLRARLGSGFSIRYAVKTNPNPKLLQWLKERIESLDVSSGGEIRHALAQGWEAHRLEFTGPAKTGAEIELAIERGIRSIVIEDLEEAELASAAAHRLGRRARVLLRIAPALAENGFAVRLAGRPTQFGVDEEQLPAVVARMRELPDLDLVGFHIYSGSQCLDDHAMEEHFAGMWELFKRAIASCPKGTLEEFVFGAGLGIPYHDGDGQLTLAGLPAVCAKIGEEMKALVPSARAYVELGRYLVGEAGSFITEVVRVKESRGVKIVVCNGGMNHNLGAAGHLGGVAHRHYPLQNLSADDGAPEETYRVVGPLCTAIDTLALRAKLPQVKAGHLLRIGCSGSYGPTASPLFFISHTQPCEVLVRRTDQGAEFEDVSWLPRLASEGPVHA